MADLLVPESHRDLFTGTTIMLSTVNPDGSIQTSAVWSLLGEDGVLRTSLSKNRQKYRNLLANPTATVFALAADNPFRFIEIRATATIEDDSDKTFLTSLLATYGRTLEQFGAPGLEPRVVVTFEAARVRPSG
ncbi:TIGR03618 family F420-dependent PPOX class oxidoreductase [Frankia sp. AgB1.9]|uniref:TIGR03618 family F420-dependent PPOX class oxidoreductase n=1 Tax=unclassified Frankia TaxID=2632575 RepID=UPI001933F2D3|nr:MULTISPECIES: TIGR03618 family F420-dependent PPOX class oxidoreductase [unclassified Frankia]MBL7494430.1 TIGR03618 family F420-dependent PPOX class oxidoreductase [Frankia sp. AgW1.1]MBL7550113.1 TIGR03618 family F420-dependent PPOX class oxidoreductase [Frankia sp. AgB1.9]MBL7621143.1 TIGR03618 family F420-dependent PPOX class oxidoreductase [Frankia sp. AgB1.8]